MRFADDDDIQMAGAVGTDKFGPDLFHRRAYIRLISRIDGRLLRHRRQGGTG
jgi:hypothetical protein